MSKCERKVVKKFTSKTEKSMHSLCPTDRVNKYKINCIPYEHTKKLLNSLTTRFFRNGVNKNETRIIIFFSLGKTHKTILTLAQNNSYFSTKTNLSFSQNSTH